MKKFITLSVLLCLLFPTTNIYATEYTSSVDKSSLSANTINDTSSIDDSYGTDSNHVEVSSPEEIVEVLAEDNDESGLITDSASESNSRYATKRIILFGKLLESYDSAKTIVTYPEYDETILEFDTEADTKAAYEELLAIYGKDNCFIDQVLDQEDLVLEGESSSDNANDSDDSDDSDLQTYDSESSNSDYDALSWGVTDMGMAQLKSIDQSYFSKTEDYDKNITVAVIDTGITSTNSIFSGRTISGYNTMTASSDFSDSITSQNGHGTHVCGIIADGTPDFASLLVIKVFNKYGNSTNVGFLTAFQYAIEHGADVINVSLGYSLSSSSSMDFLDTVIDTAYQAGIPIVTAAGNDSKNVSTTYPASNTQTIAVSGVKKTGNSTSSDAGSASSSSVAFDSSFSNYGNLIDFCAPGTSIVSAANAAGSTKATKSGTSMSAPHLTAALTWLKILYPDESVPELYEHLKSYSVDLGQTGKDIYYGNGYPKIGNLLKDRYGEDFLGNEEEENNDKQGSNTDASGNSDIDASKNSATNTSNDYDADAAGGSGSNGSNDISKSSETSKTSASSKSSGTSSTAKISSTYSPKKTRLITAKRKNLRMIRLHWKKITNVSGYQICYSRSKTFRKGKHYVTVKGKSHSYYTLKGLKRHSRIYVRVRTYKVVQKKKYYSKWSNVKMVRTR